MTRREYTLVFTVALIGLIPSFFAYHYLRNSSSFLVSSGGVAQVEQASQATLTAAAALSASRNAITEIYQSRPQKETMKLCKNSNYTSFTLALTTKGEFSLVKRCESVRDASFTWYGMASTTWSAPVGKGAEQIRALSITGDDKETYQNPLHLILLRKGDEVSVFQTELNEIATTTVFAQILKPRIIPSDAP